jgi:hypothetical protein
MGEGARDRLGVRRSPVDEHLADARVDRSLGFERFLQRLPGYGAGVDEELAEDLGSGLHTRTIEDGRG